MPVIIIRLGILLLAGLVAWGAVWCGRRFVERQRRQALAAAPVEIGGDEASIRSSSVRILAFSSEDCHQCHTLQAPALERVKERYQDSVTIEEVDAPGTPELTQRYHILTVPSTVVLDAAGRPHAVNYGFANTQRLINQVEEAITSPSAAA